MKTMRLPLDWQDRVNGFILCRVRTYASRWAADEYKMVTQEEFIARHPDYRPIVSAKPIPIAGAFLIYHPSSLRRVVISPECGYEFYLRVTCFLLASGCPVVLTPWDLPPKLRDAIGLHHGVDER